MTTKWYMAGVELSWNLIFLKLELLAWNVEKFVETFNWNVEEFVTRLSTIELSTL